MKKTELIKTRVFQLFYSTHTKYSRTKGIKAFFEAALDSFSAQFFCARLFCGNCWVHELTFAITLAQKK